MLSATAVQNRAALRLTIVGRGSLEVFLFVALPLFYAGLLGVAIATGFHPFDFHTFWWSGHDVAHGHSPYVASLPHVAHRTTFRPFVYPAPAAVAMVPVSFIPYAVANALWFVLGVAAIVGSLRLLEIRDWRCYGAVFAWPAVWSSFMNGAISALLVLGCAALWRYRTRPYVSGVLLAALVVFKLYLWPLGVWLLATRRWRASVVSIVVAVAATVAGWAVIGFAGLREYPHLLNRLTALVAHESYSPYALFRSLGASAGLSRDLMFVCGGVVLALVVERAYRGRNERAAFVVAIAASLALSPIVWPHYLALTVVVVALTWPNLGRGWEAPMTFWIVMPAWSDGNPALIGGALLVFTALFASSIYRLSRSDPDEPRRAPSILRFAVK
jgi:Glycosyltransferase family 87